MKCEICQEREGRVRLEGYGTLCMECYNDLIAEMFGTETFDDFSKEVSIIDTDGTNRVFDIWNMLIPPYSVWHADEVGGFYSFEVMTGMHDDQLEALQHLHQKVLKGIGYKTFQKADSDSPMSVGIWVGAQQYTLKEIGTMRIMWDIKKSRPTFVVDGNQVTLEQWENLLKEYEGFVMDYQMRDRSDEVLEKNMILRQYNIQPKVIEARVEKTLQWFLEEEFLPEERADACMEALLERVDDLELLYRYGDEAQALELGDLLKHRLYAIATDSQEFPQYIVEDIDRVLELDL